MDPAEIRRTCGFATLEPTDEVVADSLGTWTLTYTAGAYGIDDQATILVARRMVSDWGTPQFRDPAAEDYTTVHTTGTARLSAWWDPTGYIRPWKTTLVIRVHGGALAPGDQVVVTFGDRTGGSPGSRAQSFVESSYEFHVAVDPFGTNQFVDLPDQPTVRVVGGAATRLRVFAPSQARLGAPFAVTIKAEDRWGNPADWYRGEVRFAPTAGARGPDSCRFGDADAGARRLEGFVLERPGVHRIAAADAAAGLLAESNPIVGVEEAPTHRLYWGDIHGQTEDTVGTGSLEEYFRYGRDVAALDVISHCGNDFQITAKHYRETQEIVRRYHDPGRFVTFLAYEWSATSPTGGDHNVYFLRDDQPIHRSSHWQIADGSDPATSRHPLSALQEHFRRRQDVLILPHIGGRAANLDFHDPAFEPAIEIMSVHGIFWWFAEEALRRGLKVAFIASSDDHTGRPGSTYPSSGAHHLGMRGGLVGFYATELTREGIWEALRARRCYGTTGERIVVAVHADGHPMGAEYRASGPPTIATRVIATAPLESVDLYRGLERIHRHSLGSFAGGKRLQVVWSGARHTGRHRETTWDGSLAMEGARIVSARPFAFDHPQEGIVEVGATSLRWRSKTCGDPDGVILELDRPDEATLTFITVPCSFVLPLETIGPWGFAQDAGGVGQRVEVRWIPAEDGPREVTFTYRDEALRPGTNAYYIRVRQIDGEMAWSSPIYVEA